MDMKVYVSSTSIDLKEYRDAVISSLRKMGATPVCMDDYVAQDVLPVAKCLADVIESDVYVGIFAWRYGFIPPGYDQSITELEYRKAIEKGIPALIFLSDENVSWPDEYRDVDKDAERVNALRQEFKLTKMVGWFKSPYHLSSEVQSAVSRLTNLSYQLRRGNDELLNAWVDSLGGVDDIWAKPVVAGLRTLIEAKKRSPSWTPTVPCPPKSQSLNEPDVREVQLLGLEHSLLSDPPPDIDCERISEFFGYRSLCNLYPNLNNRWILPSGFGPPLAPFVEIWSNLSPEAPALPLNFILAQEKPYRTPVVAQKIGAMVDTLVMDRLKGDEPKLRIGSATEVGGELRIEFGFSQYSDYLRTNWAVANLRMPFCIELREQLCGTGDIYPLEKSRCSNHLGVSAIIAFDDKILLPISSSQVISSPEMLVPTVSGSADFVESYWLGAVPSPAQDILREVREELKIDPVLFRGSSTRFLSLTRNVLRGGKPEAFFYIYFPIGTPKLAGSFEHQDRPFICLPALLDGDNRPVNDFDDYVKEFLALIYDCSQNELVVSPFTRMALYYYVAYARNCM